MQQCPAAQPFGSFAKGTHDWEYQEVVIAPGDLPAAHAAVLRLTFSGKGTAWFDGVLGEETLGDDEINLLFNGSFEAIEKGWPAGWSTPVLWSWARRDYYRFTAGRMTRATWPAGSTSRR